MIHCILLLVFVKSYIIWKPFSTRSLTPAPFCNTTGWSPRSIDEQVHFVTWPTESLIDLRPCLNIVTAPPATALYHNIAATDRPTHPLWLLPTGLPIIRSAAAVNQTPRAGLRFEVGKIFPGEGKQNLVCNRSVYLSTYVIKRRWISSTQKLCPAEKVSKDLYCQKYKASKVIWPQCTIANK